jgi:hypothetical protein
MGGSSRVLTNPLASADAKNVFDDPCRLARQVKQFAS